MITTRKIDTGEFEVLWNGEVTEYRIINGSRGLSGRDTRNVYGIVHPGRAPLWIGSLPACKKLLTLTLSRKESAR